MPGVAVSFDMRWLQGKGTKLSDDTAGGSGRLVRMGRLATAKLSRCAPQSAGSTAPKVGWRIAKYVEGEHPAKSRKSRSKWA